MGILTLLKANIRYKKGSFVSVFVLTFIIALCLTTIISINSNIEKRVAESLELNNTGDIVSIIWDVNCTKEMLNKLEQNEHIKNMDIDKALTQQLEINGRKMGSSTFFMPYDTNNQTYKIFDQDGLHFIEKPALLKEGEIYVPISFMSLYDCDLGDKAYLTVGKTRQSFIIKGFFEEPFMGSEITGIKFALMNEEDLYTLFEQRLQSIEEREQNPNNILGYYIIHLHVEKTEDLTIGEVKREINEATGISDYALFTISKEQSISYTLMYTQVFSTILMAFLIIIFVVVLIVIGHSISTGIEMDFTNLGVLKAIGFGRGNLRGVFVLEYILAELLGAFMGMLLSIPAIYYLNGIFVKMTGLLSDVEIAFGICLFILLGILLLSALFVYLKTKSIHRISPVRAISGGKSSVHFHSRLELPIGGTGIYGKIAIRQLTSGLKQYISSIMIVAILTYFLVSITAISAGMDRKMIEESFGIYFSDVSIKYNPKWDKNQQELTRLIEEVEEDISSIADIENSFMIDGNYFSLNGNELQCTVYDDTANILSIVKGRIPLYDNEIVITQLAAKELGVRMGDTVKITNKDLVAEYIISGYYQCTVDMGMNMAMSYEGAKRLIPDYYMSYVEYVLKDSLASTKIREELTNKYQEDLEVYDNNRESNFGDTIIISMSILSVVIYIISILFALVVIIIICGKVFLKERGDYGIYKMLGFTSASLRFQFSLRFALVAFIGSVLGIILNFAFNSVMMEALLGNFGVSHFTADYPIASILIPIVLLTFCFFSFAFLVSRKIKRVDTRNLISNS